MLRDLAPLPVPLDDVIAEWPDAVQRERAIASVVADGLAEVRGELLQLPS